MCVPVIASNDAHFLKADDHQAHDVLLCIGLGKDFSDPNRMKYDGQLYFKNQRRDGRALSRPPGRAGEHAAHRGRVQLELSQGLPRPRLSRGGRGLRLRERDAAARGCGRARSKHYAPEGDAGGHAIRRRVLPAGDHRPGGVRAGGHHLAQLLRLLPDHGRLHPLGARARHPRGAGARLGGGVASWRTAWGSRTAAPSSSTCCSSAF